MERPSSQQPHGIDSHGSAHPHSPPPKHQLTDLDLPLIPPVSIRDLSCPSQLHYPNDLITSRNRGFDFFNPKTNNLTSCQLVICNSIIVPFLNIGHLIATDLWMSSYPLSQKKDWWTNKYSVIRNPLKGSQYVGINSMVHDYYISCHLGVMARRICTGEKRVVLSFPKQFVLKKSLQLVPVGGFL